MSTGQQQDQVEKSQKGVKGEEGEKGENNKEKSPWVTLNLGFLELSNTKGMRMKPKFDLGAEILGTGANVGLGDLRDGINVSAEANFTSQTVSGKGKNIEEFMRSLELKGKFAEILNDKVYFHRVVKFFTNMMADITKLIKIGNIEIAHMEGDCTVNIGVSADMGLSLGWKDEEKYRMIGASGSLAVGGEYRAGLHESKEKIKTIFSMALGGANFRFVVYVTRLKEGTQVQK